MYVYRRTIQTAGCGINTTKVTSRSKFTIADTWINFLHWAFLHGILWSDSTKANGGGLSWADITVLRWKDQKDHQNPKQFSLQVSPLLKLFSFLVTLQAEMWKSIKNWLITKFIYWFSKSLLSNNSLNFDIMSLETVVCLSTESSLSWSFNAFAKCHRKVIVPY